MMEWFRAHTKQIMVVVVLMAMLAFIGGDALTTLFAAGEANEKYGRVFGDTVRTRDLMAVQRDLEALEKLGLRLNTFGEKDVTPQHYYMLLAEAKAARLEASQTEIDKTLEGVAQQAQGTTVDLLHIIQQRYRIQPADVFEAIGHYIQINKNAERVLRATMPSEAEARHYAVDTEERAKVKTVVFDAAKFADPSEVIPEPEMQAHFDKYKDTLKSDGADGFGYKYPDRVKLQVIVADFSRIAAQINVTQEEASAQWRKNKAAYTISEKVPASQPAGNPGEPVVLPEPPSATEISREMNFSEAKPQIEGEIKKKKAAQHAEQAMRKASADLLKPWFVATTDKKAGYKAIPQGVQAPGYMEAIRNQAAAEAGITLEYFEIGPISRVDLANHPVVGKAKVAGSEIQRVSITDYAFHAPPLYKPTDEYDSTLRLQLYQTPDAPLPLETSQGYTLERDASGNFRPVLMPGQRTGLVLFRVVEALPSAPPATLAEVHAQVLSDLREQRAYVRMESAAKQLLAAARKIGLSDALALDEELKKKLGIKAVGTPSPFARKVGGDLSPATVDGIGAAEDFLTSAFAMSSPDWKPAESEPTTMPELPAVTTRPAVSPAPKVALVNLPKPRKRVVVEFLELQPLTEDKFTSNVRNSAFDQLFQKRAREVGREWFDPKNIEKRVNFVSLTAEQPRIAPEGVNVPEGTPPI